MNCLDSLSIVRVVQCPILYFCSFPKIKFQGVVGISEIIIKPGLINVDFADVRQARVELGKLDNREGLGYILRGTTPPIVSVRDDIRNSVLVHGG